MKSKTSAARRTHILRKAIYAGILLVLLGGVSVFIYHKLSAHRVELTADMLISSSSEVSEEEDDKSGPMFGKLVINAERPEARRLHRSGNRHKLRRHRKQDSEGIKPCKISRPQRIFWQSTE